MSDEPTVVGGRRARGARRKLNRQNTTDISARDVQPGDLLLHENFREPMEVTGVVVSTPIGSDEEVVSIQTRQASWQAKASVVVRRIEPEEAEG